MKITQILINLLIVVFLVSSSSCKKCIKGEGAIVTKTRYLSYFDGIITEGPYDLTITRDTTVKNDSLPVTITAYENLLPYISTSVEPVNDVSNLLISNANDRCIRSKKTIHIEIKTPLMAYLEHNGSGDITCYDATTLNADIYLNGSGNIVYENLSTNYLDAEINGSGDIYFGSGEAINTDLKISGSGNIDAIHLYSRKCNAKISGSGNISVWVMDKLDVYISGTGNVTLSGPADIYEEIPGAGSVIILK